MSAVDDLRIALYGNPPSVAYPPDRDGVIQAFTELYNAATAASDGRASYDTVADLQASAAVDPGTQARVYADPTATNNGVWINVTGAVGDWAFDSDYYDAVASVVQPLVDEAAASAATAVSVSGLVTTSVVGSSAIDTSGSALGSRSTVFWKPNSLAEVDRYLRSLEISVSVAGTGKILISKVETDGSLTNVYSTNTPGLPTGVQSIPENILIPAGCIYGFQPSNVGVYYKAGAIESGDAQWTTADVPTSHTAKTVETSNAVVFRATLVGAVAAKAADAYDQSSANTAALAPLPSISAAVKSLYVAGRAGKRSAPVSGTSDATAAFYVLADPLPGVAGAVVQLDIYGGTVGGNIDFYLCDPIGGNLVPNTFIGTKILTANARNQIALPADYTEGQHIGFFAATATAFRYQAGSTPYYSAGSVTSIATGSPVTTVELQVGFDVSYFDPSASIGQLPLKVVADGDSLTAGSVPAGGSAITPWPAQIATELGVTVINKGVSGQDTQQMIDDATTDIDPLADDSGHRVVLIFDGEPYNYLRGMNPATYPTDAAAAAHVVDKIQEYFVGTDGNGGRRAAGFRALLLVNMAAHNTATNVQKEGCWDRTTTQAAVNAEMARRWPDFADGLIDIASASQLSDYTDTTYYQSVDGVHYTTAGQTVVKNRVRAALAQYRN